MSARLLDERERPKAIWSEALEVVGSRGRLAGFVIVALVVTFLYTILLPFDYTQRFELANWNYLNAYLLAWAIALGLAMSLVIMVQIYATRRIATAQFTNGTAGGFALIASLLPSFLCCTPIIPTALAFIGLSGVSLYGTTGTLQHFFAVHQTEFLVASMVILIATAWLGLRKLVNSQCASGSSCASPTKSRGVSEEVGV